MREQPEASELLDGVAEFMRDELMPHLSGRLAFHTRVAINVLAIVRRELELRRDAEKRETERLVSLLGCDGDAEALTVALSDRISGGEIDTDDPALLNHLWSTTLDTLAIDQPNYATYRRAIAEQASTIEPKS